MMAPMQDPRFRGDDRNRVAGMTNIWTLDFVGQTRMALFLG